MPLWVPQKGAMLRQNNFGNVGSLTLGTSVTTGGTSAVKTSPMTQLIAATEFDAYAILVTASGYGSPAALSRGCLDIGIGAATEEVLISNLLMGQCGSIAGVDPGGIKTWWFPLYIPAGTRIAAATAGIRTSTACFVGVEIYGGHGYPPWRVGTRVITYGIGTVPAGTTTTPGASAAEGAWAPVTASTTEPCFCIVPSAQAGSADTTLTASGVWMDIATGAAAAEELIADGGRQHSFVFGLTGAEMIAGPINPTPLFADIPTGTRLSTRLSRSSVADTTAAWETALHCVSG